MSCGFSDDKCRACLCKSVWHAWLSHTYAPNKHSTNFAMNRLERDTFRPMKLQSMHIWLLKYFYSTFYWIQQMNWTAQVGGTFQKQPTRSHLRRCHFMAVSGSWSTLWIIRLIFTHQLLSIYRNHDQRTWSYCHAYYALSIWIDGNTSFRCKIVASFNRQQNFLMPFIWTILVENYSISFMFKPFVTKTY